MGGTCVESKVKDNTTQAAWAERTRTRNSSPPPHSVVQEENRSHFWESNLQALQGKRGLDVMGVKSHAWFLERSWEQTHSSFITFLFSHILLGAGRLEILVGGRED
jgi:hypothetical protein